MRTIAISNQKGGSCKTTTAVTLSAALGRLKRKVLLIDLDPQAHTTYWLKMGNVEKGLFVVMAHNEEIVDNVYPTQLPNVDLLPANDWLYGIGKALANEIGPETILQRKLMKIPKSKWDYVLIDCPPDLGILTVNALGAVREVVIPVEASALALSGVAKLTRTIEMIQERINPEIQITGVLVCKHESTLLSGDVVNQLKAVFGKALFKDSIPKNVRIAECPSSPKGLSIFEYAPECSSARAYMNVAKQIIQQEREVRKYESAEKRLARQPA